MLFKVKKSIAFVDRNEPSFILFYGTKVVGDEMSVNSNDYTFLYGADDPVPLGLVKDIDLELKVTWVSQDTKGRDIYSCLITSATQR